MKKLLLTLLAAILLAGCTQAPVLDNRIGEQTSEEEQAFNASGQAKAIEDPTDLWQFHENSKAGFSLKFPHDVILGENLRIESEFVSSLGERPLGYTTENATNIRDSLATGEFGKNEIDWPLEDSKQVKSLGVLNGQDFLVLGRFEVCDVTFERKLVFYSNDHQTIITLETPKEPIIAENPEIFTTDAENCFEEKIWNFDKQVDFYKSLSKGKSGEAAQAWFDTFDAIVETIEFITPESKTEALDSLESLQGFWVSIDDPKSTVEFKGEKKTDFYDGEKISEEFFEVDGDSLVVNAGADTIQYSIVDVSIKYLTLLHLPRGNMLKYKR
jgi:hypothetical protein